MNSKLLTAGVVLSIILSGTAVWLAMPLASKKCLREKIVHAFQEDPVHLYTTALQGAEIHRRQEEAEAQKAQLEKVQKLWGRLTASTLPFVGNPDGKKTIVEFFDYNCGYCRKANEVITKLIAEDPTIKVIYHPVPLFSNPLLVQAVLAAKAQGKYKDFHQRLFSEQCDGSKQSLTKLAKACNLDVNRFLADLESDAIKAEVADTQELYKELEITGTPAYIVDKGDIIPGHIELDEFKALLTSTSEDQKKN